MVQWTRLHRQRVGGDAPPLRQPMLKVLVLQALYGLSDGQAELRLRDRLSFMRFAGLALADPVPDATAIWLFREQLVVREERLSPR